MEDDDISSIDSLSDNILDEEDDKEMLGLLSEMVFTAQFEKYVKNSITKLINNNFKNIEPLFIIKEYSLQETIEEFQKFSTNIIKEKKIINKSFNIQLKTKSNEFDINQSEIKAGNDSEIKISEGIIDINKNMSSSSIRTEDSKYIFYNNKNKINQSNISANKGKILEINDFFDTFNLKGKEFECHAQILLAQILKCLEKKENSFKFLCNIEFKFKNIIKDINDIELDFAVNNISSNHLYEFLKYLKKNILLFKFQKNIYEINNSKSFDFDKILLRIKESKKFDILGEIGLNAINDANKLKQFNNYSELLNVLKSDPENNKLNLFYEKTGFSKENDKILFFVTDSKFNEIYKKLKDSILYKEMINQDKDVNFVLCYLSNGINEQIILNKFIINYKDNQENKKNLEIKENKEDKEDNESQYNKELFDKIKLSYKNHLKSEKFQLSCNKINELLITIDKINNNFNKNEKENIQDIYDSLSNRILKQKFEFNIKLEEYFKKYKISINYINKYNIEDEFTIIYLKNNNKVDEDIILEILKEKNINFITINYEQKEDQTLKNLKMNNSLFKIYIIIVNLDMVNKGTEGNITNCINNMIQILKITEAHYIFIFDTYNSGIIKISNNTLENNIKISKNKNEFLNQFKETKNKIKSYYKDFRKIIIEKKYYDTFIKIFIQKTRNYINESLNSDEKNLIKKINQILYFIINLELNENINEEIAEEEFNDLFNFINDTIENYINSKISKKMIENIFNEVKNFFGGGDKIEMIENKSKSFCRSYLKRYILNEIYNYFINNIIPKISFQIFNEKIKELLLEKEKTDDIKKKNE